MPKMHKYIDSVPGTDFYVRQDSTSRLNVFTLQEGKVKKYAMDSSKGEWLQQPFTSEEYNLIDSDIRSIQGDFIETQDVMLLGKVTETRAIADPDETGAYDFSSPYRLYWAYDTKKMYINIADAWIFCGTLIHDLLEGSGKYSHAAIDEFIDNNDPVLANKVKVLEEAMIAVMNRVTQLELTSVDHESRIVQLEVGGVAEEAIYKVDALVKDIPPTIANPIDGATGDYEAWQLSDAERPYTLYSLDVRGRAIKLNDGTIRKFVTQDKKLTIGIFERGIDDFANGDNFKALCNNSSAVRERTVLGKPSIEMASSTATITFTKWPTSDLIVLEESTCVRYDDSYPNLGGGYLFNPTDNSQSIFGNYLNISENKWIKKLGRMTPFSSIGHTYGWYHQNCNTKEGLNLFIPTGRNTVTLELPFDLLSTPDGVVYDELQNGIFYKRVNDDLTVKEIPESYALLPWKIEIPAGRRYITICPPGVGARSDKNLAITDENKKPFKSYPRGNAAWNITKLHERIDNIPTTEINGMSGNIQILPGNNVQIVNDTTTKSITISFSGSGGSTALTDLTDVAISYPSNRDILYYDTSTSKWQNSDMFEGLRYQVGLNTGNISVLKTRVDTIEESYDKTAYIPIRPEKSSGRSELDVYLDYHWPKVLSGVCRTIVLVVSDLTETYLDKYYELPEDLRIIATKPLVIKCEVNPNNLDTTSDAYFKIRGDRTYFENITMIPSDPTTETHHAISFVHQNADGRYVSHIGNEFYKCMFQEWKNKAVKVFGGWHKKFDLCIFKWCSTGVDYHAMDVPNDGWWSASGDIFERCTFIENDIGIYAEYHKQLAINSCVFEFNGCPFDLVSCDGTVFKNPWLEANYGSARISGEIVVYGGRNFDTFSVEFKKDAEKLITLLQNGVKQFKGNVLIVSDTFDAWNTVHSNSFKNEDGWYFEGAHIVDNFTMLSGNPILSLDTTTGFLISPPISIGAKEWEISFGAYNPIAASKIKIVPRVIDISSGNPVIVEFLPAIEITLDAWGAWAKKRVTFTAKPLANGNVFNFAFEVVTRGGQLEIGDIIISKEKGLTFVPSYKLPNNTLTAPNRKLFTNKVDNTGAITPEQFYFS